MKTIQLTQGFEAMVDDDFPEQLVGASWYVSRSRIDAPHYARTKTFGRKAVLMHRAVIGAKEGEVVDHINGNTLDNRKENLRICSAKENARNRRVHRNSPHGFRGVRTSHRSPSRFTAYIRVDGKKKYLGTFKAPEIAARAYDEAARAAFGEYARLNFNQ